MYAMSGRPVEAESAGKKAIAYSYHHPRPAVAVDVVIFSIRNQRLEVLLIERGVAPFKNSWAVPGGFVRMNEDLATAAARELKEETGVDASHLSQVGAFGAPTRDPRGRVISIAFYAVLRTDTITLKASTDAAQARWWPFAQMPRLAFDHSDIITAAHRVLADSLPNSRVPFQFLAEEFTLSELQQVHEAIRGEVFDKRNFRKWITGQGSLRATGRYRRAGQHRPAQLFRLRAPAGRHLA
jgi:8-oxo-dGTP diphosphatase